MDDFFTSEFDEIPAEKYLTEWDRLWRDDPPPPTRRLIGGATRDARRARGWSQAELAQRLGKTRVVVALLELNHESVIEEQIVDQLAQAFDLTPEAFITAAGLHAPPVAELRAAGQPERTIMDIEQTWSQRSVPARQHDAAMAIILERNRIRPYK